MDTISFNISIISRGKGRSAVQIAAYNSRTKLHSKYTGKTYDSSHKKDLVFHKIYLPDNAPLDFLIQEILWNEVEKVEKNRNARLARVLIISLPKEIERNEQLQMIEQYVSEYFVSKGMCADVAVHDKKDNNPHAHILLTTRSLDQDGKWMSKQHRNYIRDDNGEKIIDEKTNKPKLGKSIKTNDWDNKENAEIWRKGWSDICNEYFEKLHIPRKVTHMSYARQGINLEPTKHLGAVAKALEDKGIYTDRGNENRAIAERNRRRKQRIRDEINREYSIERECDYDRDR